MAKEGDLQIWWVPQMPMRTAFYVDVATPQEAVKLLMILADYDLFQLKQHIKPDYSNAGGLNVFEDDEWCDWEDAEGRDVDDLIREVARGLRG